MEAPGRAVNLAFLHLQAGNNRYEIHNVPHRDLPAYERAYKAKELEFQEFYAERPFTEERVVSRSECQADPFYIKYQNNIIFGSLALASVYAVYRFARPLFIDMKEAQALYQKCRYYYHQTTFGFIMSGRGYFENNNFSKSVPFVGLSFSPSSIRNGFIMTGVTKISIPMGLMYVALFKAPIVPSRNLHTISFIRERHVLDNEKRDDQYVCPISDKLLSVTEGRSPIRYHNRLFDSDALVGLWLKRGRCVVPEERQAVDLYGRAARVFEIPEQNIRQIVDFRISMQEAAQMAVGKNGRFTQIAINVLGISLKAVQYFDSEVPRIVEEVMRGDTMQGVLNKIPKEDLEILANLISDQEAQWSDIFSQALRIVGGLRVTIQEKINFNPTCYVFDYFMKQRCYQIQHDEAYQTFLLKKKIKAFRDLKIEYLQSNISEDVLDSQMELERLKRFKLKTGVNLGGFVEVVEEV